MNRIQKAALDRNNIRKQAGPLADLIHKMREAKDAGKDPFDVTPPKRSDSTPPASGTSTKSRSQPENQVVQACLRWLKERGIFAWRNNTGVAWVGDRPIRYGLPGSGDILGLLPDGRFLSVECKSEKGRQSDAQKEFEQLIKSNNGVYVLAYSTRDLETVLPDSNTIVGHGDPGLGGM